MAWIYLIWVKIETEKLVSQLMFAEWNEEIIRFKLPVVGFITKSKKAKVEAKNYCINMRSSRNGNFGDKIPEFKKTGVISILFSIS